MSQESSAAIDGVVPIALYEQHRTIHVRSVQGTFARWRWAMVWLTQAVFYGLCWLPWNGRQAVLFDIVERKFYLFGLVLWPQDVLYLAVLLIVAAYSLFLFTAVGGRLFCGYTLRLMNTDERPHQYLVSASGLDGLTLAAAARVSVAAASMKSLSMPLRVGNRAAGKGSHPVYFDIADIDAANVKLHEKAVFIMP